MTFVMLFTASVRSRPPGPPAVPGVSVFVVVFTFGLWIIPEHYDDIYFMRTRIHNLIKASINDCKIKAGSFLVYISQ